MSGEFGFVLFVLYIPRKVVVARDHAFVNTEEFENHRGRLRADFARIDIHTQRSAQPFEGAHGITERPRSESVGRYATGATQSGTRDEESDALLNTRTPGQNLVEQASPCGNKLERHSR